MKILKKISLIIIGFLLSLVILEVGLQITGFTLNTIKKYRNKTTKDQNTTTILCLGESTTDGQWPPILQKILNEKSKHKKFTIIDEGITGTNTKIISDKISDNLIKYNPDIVIMMMGINDNGLDYKKYKLKILSFFSLIYTHIRQFFYYTEEDIEYLNHLVFDLSKDRLLKIMNRIYNKTGMVDHFFIILLSRYIAELNYNDEYANKIMENLINNKIYFTIPDLDGIISYLENVKQYNKEEIKIFIIQNKNKIKYEDILTDSLLKEYNLSHLLNDIKNNSFNIPNYKNIKKSNNLIRCTNKKNYQYIISEIYKNNKNILVLPMQYPTLPIEDLKNDLKNTPYYDKLIFISNENNFKTALEKYKIEEVFRDMFGGSFGHCTDIGNTLIAENVAETILKLYN